jgi:hypothetical protein
LRCIHCGHGALVWFGTTALYANFGSRPMLFQSNDTPICGALNLH